MKSMTTSRHLSTLLTTSLLLAACGAGASTIPTGDPLPSPVGEPASACERAEWYQLVPTRSFTSQSSTGGGLTTTVQERVIGYSIYRAGSSDPEDLRDVLPLLDEPTFARTHLAAIEPILARAERSDRAMTWGLYTTGAGVGAFLLGGSVEAGIAGSLVGLGLGFYSLLTEPSQDERAYAYTRQHTFAEVQANMEAARRGIARLNERQRAECSG